MRMLFEKKCPAFFGNTQFTFEGRLILKSNSKKGRLSALVLFPWGLNSHYLQRMKHFAPLKRHAA